MNVRRTVIKVCGVRTEEAMETAVEAGADLVGFVLAEGSPRTVSMNDAIVLARGLPEHVEPVAVFRDQPIETIQRWPFTAVQLHGDESEAMIADLSTKQRYRVMRGFSWSRAAFDRWRACADVDVLLIDGPKPGSGEPFDHDALSDHCVGVETRVFLAGGLTPENVGEAMRTVRPFGVDVSSGVESAPGVKDPALIRRFCEAVREADASLAS